MKREYTFYNERIVIRQRVVDEIRHQAGDEKSQQSAGQIKGVEKGQRFVGQLGIHTNWLRNIIIQINILFNINTNLYVIAMIFFI